MTRVFSLTRHGILLLAIAMVSFAGWSIAAKHALRVTAPPPIAAPTNPYDDNVAGTGIVEPASSVRSRGHSVASGSQQVIAGTFRRDFNISDHNSI